MNALTIYVDVLIILNVYVNYFLLRTTAKLNRSPLRIWRCIAASFYGSLFSLMILAPKLPVLLSLGIKTAGAFTIVIAAFGVHGSRRLMKNTFTFFAVNFIFAGVIYAVYSWLKPQFMHFSNSCFYIDFSLLLLVTVTAVLYGAVCLFRRFTAPPCFDDTQVMIRCGGKVSAIEGLADTGNALIDCFTGRPVMICSREDIGDIPARVRLIPCSTVSDTGVIPVFRPDEVVIVNRITGEKKPVDVMIGLGKCSGRAVYDPKILKY